MATIGSITIAFDTDISKLVDGIAEAVSEVESLKEEIGSAGGEVSLRVSVDSRSAASQIAKLKTAADSVADVSSAVRVKIEGVADVDRLRDSISGVTDKSVRLAVAASGLGSVDELRDAINGVQSKSVTAAVEASGLGSVDELKAALDGVNGKSVTAAVEASGLGSVGELKAALDGVESKSVTAAVEASGFGSVDELKSALDGINSKSVTAAVEASGLGSVDELRSALDGIESKSVTAAVEASGLGSVGELKAALDGVESKSVTAAVEASGLASVDELRSALNGIESKSVTAAVEASGFGSADELRSALDGIESKSVTAAVEASGLGSVDELRSALDGIQSKSVTAAVEASGLGSVDELKTTLDGIESKSVTAAVEASGLGSVDELKTALNGIESKSVAAAVEASGLSSVDELRSALDGVQSKSVTAAVEASGLGSVDELRSALDGVQSKSVTAAVEASGLGSVDELKAALDGIESKSVTAAVEASGLDSVEELKSALDGIQGRPVSVDVSQLSESIEESLVLFDELTDSIDALVEQLDDLSSSTVKIKPVVDSAAIEKAGKDVQDLSTEVTVKVNADAEPVSRLSALLGSLRQSFGQLAGVSGSAAKETERFSENAATAAESTDSLATRLRRVADVALLRSTGQAADDAKRYSDKAAEAAAITETTGDALKSAASAARGFGEAATLAASGNVSITSAIDKSIIAVGRSRDAYIAGSTAVGTAAASLGGYSTVAAAVAGSTTATAVSVGTLAGALAGAGTSLAVYTGIMAATRSATANLSEESKEYVGNAARVGAVGVAAAAGVRVSAAAYRIVGTAVLDSSSAMGFFQRVIQGTSLAATQAAARVGGLSTAYSNLLPAIELVVGASNKDISLAQYAALTTRVIATSAALGAAGGALEAFAAGTSAAGGAASGAIASVGGLASAMPAIAPLAIGAAVATGRFAHELEHLSLAAQATDQMATRFGSSQEEMSKLRLAAQNTNVSMGQLAKGQQAFYTNLNKVKIGQLNVDSVREAKLAYDRLGISVSDLKKDSPEESFKKVAKALSEIEDPAKRTALAFDLFGRQGAAILPALKEIGELEADFQRLGGALTKIDFQRFLTLETSFDRIKASSANLSQTLLIPFVELQKAFNNLIADMKGGLSSALTPIMGILADITKPLAVVIELFGRVINIMLRIAGAVGTIAAAFLDFAMIADLVAAVGDAFMYMLSYVESAVSVLEKIASVISSLLRPSITSLSESIYGFGKVFGEVVVGAIVSLALFQIAMQSTAVQAAASAAIAYAGIGAGLFGLIIASIPVVVGYMALFAASWIGSAATALSSAIMIHAAWLLALGPIGLIIGGIELVVLGLVALYAACGGLDDILSVIGSALYYIGEATGVVAVINLISAAFGAIYAVGEKVYGAFASVGEALGLIGDKSSEIDAATASTEELAAAAEKAAKPVKQKAAEAISKATAMNETVQVDFGGENSAQVNFDKSRAAAVEFGMSMGLTAEQAEAAVRVVEDTTKDLSGFISRASAEYAESFKGPSREEITSSIEAARGAMGDLIIESARFGEAGADASNKFNDDFNELQNNLKKTGNLKEFEEESEKLSSKLRETLDTLRDDSPQITIKKNIELYKKLDDSVKEVGKSVRELSAGMVIDGKLFPSSEVVKANAESYKNEYASALDEIKKKLQSGGFTEELKVRRETLQSDFDSGNISQEEFTTKKLELDTTSAQEQASIAGEEAKRAFDRQFKKLGEEVSFAENIRKELETAFLSPIQKFEKELKKIKDNPELTEIEKVLAETNIRKQAREDIVGKSAQTQLQERSRDVNQAAEAGLINTDEMNAELKKASEDFAAAVGVTKTPFESFSSSLDNIAKQFGFAGQPIDVVREKLKGNAEQLALFDRAVKESRDNLLSSLGIEKTPQQVFDEQIKKIDEAVNATDENKKITPEQAEQARAAATRKRDEALGAGADVGGQLRERQAKIEEAFGGGKDPAKLAVAQNNLDIEKRSAAGLDATPAQALQAGVDKVNDAFDVTGKSMAEIQASLSPDDFKDYQEAIKKNKEAVAESLGVQKPSILKLQEAQDKLADAVGENVISQEQAGSAARKLRDDFMSSLGVAKTPFEEFSGALDNIADQFDMAGQPLDSVREKLKGNADQLALFDRAVKTARDNLLSSLGIEKTPQQIFEEQMKKIEEAVASTDPNKQISKEQAEQARTNATRKRDEALGGESAADFGGRIKEQRAKIEEAYGKDGANDPEKFKSAMRKLNESIPGAEQQSPVQKFQEDLEKLKETFGEGTPEFEQNKKNLQAQLQQDLAPALDATKADRRGVEASDSRSKGGVDTFFRILRGNDNPSLKAQLDIARNTRILADASKNPDAAPVIAQLSAPR
jgi:hypothetical protein